jgi:hypothetical protein
MQTRQARVRPAYNDWYPRISPEVWHNAAWVMEIVLQQQRRGSPRWTLSGRPLDEAHFDFRGLGPRQGRLLPRVLVPEESAT